MRYDIRHFKTLPSTNDTALAMAREGAPEGVVITTDYQTRGRGTKQRKWISPRGWNLLFSIVVRPRTGAHKAPLLTRIAANAVKAVLTAECPGVVVRIKKPNDVLMNEKKIGGILVESSSKGGKLDFAVVGMGINVGGRMSTKISGSTSIYEEISKKIEKNKLLTLILEEFKLKYLECFNSSEFN